MRKPVIGLICGHYLDGGRALHGLRPSYLTAIRQSGGLPVMVVPGLESDDLHCIYERLDGIVLAGGGDIDPAHYGMALDSLIQEIDPDRDRAELAFARWAMDDDKPLLGICRGAQIANVALGGTLYRDIATEYPGFTGLDHALWGKFPREHIGHTVKIVPNTRLAESLGGAATLGVNSLHHQALRDVPAPLVITARAEDGIIEGVEVPGARFYVAVQWHPEELFSRSERMRCLFAAFVRAARQ